MIKFISNWWHSFQFKLALQQGNKQKAINLLRVIEKSGTRLSWLERLFRDKLQLEDSAKQYKQEAFPVPSLKITITGKTYLFMLL